MTHNRGEMPWEKSDMIIFSERLNGMYRDVRAAIKDRDKTVIHDLARQQLDGGADVNHVDTGEGWTALMLAASEGHRPVVEVLLHSGANAAAVDKDGDKAIDHARNRGQTDIVTLLQSGS